MYKFQVLLYTKTWFSSFVRSLVLDLNAGHRAYIYGYRHKYASLPQQVSGAAFTGVAQDRRIIVKAWMQLHLISISASTTHGYVASSFIC